MLVVHIQAYCPCELALLSGYSDYTHQAYCIAVENKSGVNVPHSSLRTARGPPKSTPVGASPKKTLQHPIDEPFILNETNKINKINASANRYW